MRPLPLVYRGPRAGRSQSGLGDVAASVKGVVLPETGRRPALGAKAAFKSDSGDASRALGTGDKDWSLAALATKTWGRHSAHAMVGHAFVGDRHAPQLRDAACLGVGGDYAWNARWSALAEAFGGLNADPTVGSDPAALRVGTILSWSKKAFWDASVAFGLTPASPRWTLTLGLTLAP